MIHPDDRIIIVGAGCFGASAALHFLDRGFGRVTILDRAPTLPAPDAASNDLNKVVRTSYADIFYTKLACEAVKKWRDRDAWGGAYHESGVVVLGDALAPDSTYASQACHNDVSAGAPVEPLRNPDQIRGAVLERVSPRDALHLGPFAEHATGYLSRQGGWVEAGRATQLALDQVAKRGGLILSGKDVQSIEIASPGTRKVKCRDGSAYESELVVLAAGAWTASAFPSLLHLDEKCLATGQCIATVQLTQEEAEVYRNCPVILNFSTGFYIFPPNSDNVVKLAIHAAGYTHTPSNGNSTDPDPLNDSAVPRVVSTPRTVSNAAEDGLRIPTTALAALRSRLQEVFPDLAKKPFSGTRMCWYTDSPDGDWVIGFHPQDPAILLATGGSGHAFKFLPVIGRLVVDAAMGELDSALVRKFAVDRACTSVDRSRVGMDAVEELDLDQLCRLEDLLP